MYLPVPGFEPRSSVPRRVCYPRGPSGMFCTILILMIGGSMQNPGVQLSKS